MFSFLGFLDRFLYSSNRMVCIGKIVPNQHILQLRFETCFWLRDKWLNLGIIFQFMGSEFDEIQNYFQIELKHCMTWCYESNVLHHQQAFVWRMQFFLDELANFK